MAAFNVNAARAQRLEALGLTWDFEVDGETFSLPTEIPRRSAHTLAELKDNDLDGLLALLMGEEGYQRLCQHEVSVQDIAAILEAYGQDTGLGVGEG
ncbi:hypothetical protein ACFV27_16215 [Streptomyces antimycoticus]|uniref:Uncharacterized protein n=2 Tax=Streptomyces violaceusniger group TaxID=2839105 RepID=A0ABD5J7F9_9ACTN|nr:MULTISPECIES: hypothetical protein [Streptomyces]MEE4584302.1 hypothetical protein [Streptomyces sp. DSM 41602]KUL45364.1 hypothetical protein ADL28_38285 [Streptomyces violaceusniger]QTI87544.1 hypothetical protein AS97_41815 [Streptomyces sp. AgN23]RSS44799.1 hypothetical protein EF902_15570 [Streptomyces sp. WAC05858]WJE01522.1 hypothetical protein QR300_39425 [Streptomyces antimycoticus]